MSLLVWARGRRVRDGRSLGSHCVPTCRKVPATTRSPIGCGTAPLRRDTRSPAPAATARWPGSLEAKEVDVGEGLRAPRFVVLHTPEAADGDVQVLTSLPLLPRRTDCGLRRSTAVGRDELSAGCARRRLSPPTRAAPARTRDSAGSHSLPIICGSPGRGRNEIRGPIGPLISRLTSERVTALRVLDRDRRGAAVAPPMGKRIAVVVVLAPDLVEAVAEPDHADPVVAVWCITPSDLASGTKLR